MFPYFSGRHVSGTVQIDHCSEKEGNLALTERRSLNESITHRFTVHTGTMKRMDKHAVESHALQYGREHLSSETHKACGPEAP